MMDDEEINYSFGGFFVLFLYLSFYIGGDLFGRKGISFLNFECLVMNYIPGPELVNAGMNVPIIYLCFIPQVTHTCQKSTATLCVPRPSGLRKEINMKNKYFVIVNVLPILSYF